MAVTPPGTKAEVKVLRKGKRKVFSIKLGELPEEEVLPTKNESGEELGLELQEITSEFAKKHNLPSDRGLIVMSVVPGSAAGEAGLRRGDIILEVNQKSVDTVAEFIEVVSSIKQGKTMLFLIKRREGSLYVPVERE